MHTVSNIRRFGHCRLSYKIRGLPNHAYPCSISWRFGHCRLSYKIRGLPNHAYPCSISCQAKDLCSQLSDLGLGDSGSLQWRGVSSAFQPLAKHVFPSGWGPKAAPRAWDLLSVVWWHLLANRSGAWNMCLPPWGSKSLPLSQLCCSMWLVGNFSPGMYGQWHKWIFVVEPVVAEGLPCRWVWNSPPIGPGRLTSGPTLDLEAHDLAVCQARLEAVWHSELASVSSYGFQTTCSMWWPYRGPMHSQCLTKLFCAPGATPHVHLGLTAAKTGPTTLATEGWHPSCPARQTERREHSNGPFPPNLGWPLHEPIEGRQLAISKTLRWHWRSNMDGLFQQWNLATAGSVVAFPGGSRTIEPTLASWPKVTWSVWPRAGGFFSQTQFGKFSVSSPGMFGWFDCW